MKQRYYITPSRLDNMTVRKNGKVTRTLKGGELYTAIEAIKYNILHLLSPVDMHPEHDRNNKKTTTRMAGGLQLVP